MLDLFTGLPMLMPSVVVFVAVVLAIYGLAAFLKPDIRWQRLDAMAPKAAAVSVRKGGSRLERLASQSFGRRLAPTDQRERANLKVALARAGYDLPTAVQAYYGIRLVLALSFAVVSLLILPIAVPSPERTVSLLFSTALVAGIAGFMTPVFWTMRRRASRQRRIREGLPPVLDLLLVCTEAGLGLDMAIAKVGDEVRASEPLLGEQLNLISAELRAGRPRASAFRGFAERTGVQEVSSLVNLLVQSDTLGTSMSGTLRVVAADMRDHQLLRAEELAQKVTAKLSMVLVGCFMPALVIAIMAPVIYHIIDTWQDIHI